MQTQPEQVLPQEIERRSFQIIEEELRGRALDPENAPVIKRVIHATADFDFADTLYFSSGAVAAGVGALRAGAGIVTDTRMAQAGINKRVLSGLGGQAYCYMDDPRVAAQSRENGTTRAVAAMQRAAALPGRPLYCIGNAPTALMELCALMEQGRVRPSLVIGVPVGFVNVVYAKELLLAAGVPCIVARGRKGGSTVAAAICNALLYRAAGICPDGG